MISVVIPTFESERRLVPTLASLVPGSTDGLVREVILADGGSRDETHKIADAAGCELVRGPRDEGARLASASDIARGAWLLFLDPGAVLDEGWTREVRSFIERQAGGDARAATFRLAIEAGGAAARMRETAGRLRFLLRGRPRPDQGLLIAKATYRSLGGHTAGPDARRRLLAKIGRRRIAALHTRILLAA